MNLRNLAIVGVLAASGLIFLLPTQAQASSLAISPLEYHTKLEKNDVKKGYVDVVNSSTQTKTIELKVQAFRQIDNRGGLEFFDNQQIEKGIKLDLESVNLKAGEGARVYFLLDSKSLPVGDVFAVILAGSSGKKAAGVNPAVQVGTLLMVENVKSPKHQAEITKLEANRFQFASGVMARFNVKNIDNPNGEALGFSPEIKVQIKPYFQKVVDGPLLFTGFNRDVTFSEVGNYFGPVLFSVSAGDSQMSKWLFLMTGFYRCLVPAVVIVVTVVAVTWRQFVKRQA